MAAVPLDWWKRVCSAQSASSRFQAVAARVSTPFPTMHPAADPAGCGLMGARRCDETKDGPVGLRHYSHLTSTLRCHATSPAPQHTHTHTPTPRHPKGGRVVPAQPHMLDSWSVLPAADLPADKQPDAVRCQARSRRLLSSLPAPPVPPCQAAHSWHAPCPRRAGAWRTGSAIAPSRTAARPAPPTPTAAPSPAPAGSPLSGTPPAAAAW